MTELPRTSLLNYIHSPSAIREDRLIETMGAARGFLAVGTGALLLFFSLILKAPARSPSWALVVAVACIAAGLLLLWHYGSTRKVVPNDAVALSAADAEKLVNALLEAQCGGVLARLAGAGRAIRYSDLTDIKRQVAAAHASHRAEFESCAKAVKTLHASKPNLS